MPPASTPKRPSAAAIALGVVPFAAMCFSVPLWDRIHPMVLGLPFNLFWLISWMALTPLCMGIAHRLDRPRAPGGTGGGAEKKGP